MTTLKQIEDFIAAQPVALVGVSRNPKKFGHMAFKELRDKGLNIVPVNPAAEQILGVRVYPDVNQLPPEVKGIIIMTKKDQTATIVRDALARGIKNIWIQQHSDSKEALMELKKSDSNFITGECIMMHYKPHSVHKFHKAILKFFGAFPR